MSFETKRRLRPLRPLYSRVLQTGAPVTINSPVGQFRWQVDDLTCQGFLRGTFETHMVEAFQQFIAPGSVFYDIGAYAGYHSLIGATLGAKVYSFEPFPGNRASIRKQLKLNSNLDITLIPYALTDKDGEAEFDTSHSSGSSSRFRLGNGDLTVACRRLDSLELPVPDVIKLDVEGHERQVLLGGEQMLRESYPVILSDHAPSTLEVMKEVLEPWGYTVRVGPPIIAAKVLSSEHS